MMQECTYCGSLNVGHVFTLGLCADCYDNHSRGLCESSAGKCEACAIIAGVL